MQYVCALINTITDGDADWVVKLIIKCVSKLGSKVLIRTQEETHTITNSETKLSTREGDEEKKRWRWEPARRRRSLLH